MVTRLCLYIIVVLAVLRTSLARGIDSDLIKYTSNNNGLGSYSFEYETSDGTHRREDGGMVARPGGEVLVVRGEYGYIDPEGRKYLVHYVADENGFQPKLHDDNTRFNDRRLVKK